MSEILKPIENNPFIFWIHAYDEATYHAQSYLLRHPEGDILIDVPPFTPEVVHALQEQSDLSYLFITHKDDIGSADRFVEFFHVTVILHHSEVRYFKPHRVDVPFEGDFHLNREIIILHLPGHTPGSAVLLDLRKPSALFAGDVLNIDKEGNLFIPPHPWDYDPHLKRLTLRKLMSYEFDLILPAHPHSPDVFILQDGKKRLEELLRREL